MSTVVPSAEANVNSSAFKSALMALLRKSPLTAMFKLAVKHTRLLEISQRGEAIYEEHNDWIRSLVRTDNLLEFNVKQGWEPLCQFLDKPVPATPFPQVNSEEQYLATVGAYQQKMLFQAMINLAFYTAPFVLVVGTMAYAYRTS